MRRLPILCLDFDGVLYSYGSGWLGADVLPDPPTEGAMSFLGEAVEVFHVHVYSTRSHQTGGVDAMRNWLIHYLVDHYGQSSGWDIVNQINFPTYKPPARVGLDDRQLTFEGDWPNMETLLNFKPYYRREANETN